MGSLNNSSRLSIQVIGKVTMITGGYGHLGKAICESMADNGSIVYVFGRDPLKFERVFNRSSNKKLIKFIKGDIQVPSDFNKAFAKIVDKEGKIDVLINNAFYIRGQSPTELDSVDFNYSLEGCLTSVFTSIKESLPYLQSGASIINVSSMYGLVAPDFRIYENSPQFLSPPHYGVAKAGVIQLTRYYASYLGKSGIRVNTISPGPFPSENVQKDESFTKALENKTVMGRIGIPMEVAGAFVFLASDAAKYITGQNIIVDGGWTSV